jgi:hypothetical protein
VFVVTAFFSAALVFMVEPMMARLVLPVLGGSAAVWNTSLAFFQAALLLGYVYAHLLQRIKNLGVQILLHLAVLAMAGAALPLHIATVFGEPSSVHPALWLVGVLAVSIGAPFAALSATAPLVQAWRARSLGDADAREPYGLYAASNLGSLIALIAYPTVVEPTLRLHTQALAWTAGYAVFVLLAASLGAVVWLGRRPTSPTPAAPGVQAGASGVWRERLVWLALAAIPSSLMLGVTTYVTTDIVSAPFLWVAPLALYLTTFIIAFQAKPAVRPHVALALQAASLAVCALCIHLTGLASLGIHLVCFFLTALICHQALVARRPAAERLTDFYVWMSLGGVIGGAFNAFVAPAIFNSIVEYPAVLILSCLARPWGRGPPTRSQWIALAVVLSSVGLAAFLLHQRGPLNSTMQHLSLATSPAMAPLRVLAVAVAFAVVLRDRAPLFALAILLVMPLAERTTDYGDGLQSWRSFFGVLSLSHDRIGALGDVKIMMHGTTLHGAQSPVPAYRCRPLVYYAPETPIGQVFTAVRRLKPAINVGAVGLGTGAVAAYTRPGDSLRFFEIDPVVIRVASDPKYFSYTTACARGRISYTLGDARLTLGKQPPGQYDILLIDAFSSDSVPAHLLTVEAMRMYFSKLAPGGVLVLHLSNRNLDLMRPAQAVARAAGGAALRQVYAGSEVSAVWASSEQAVIVGQSRAALAPFLSDPRWSIADAEGVKPWTDDYTDVFGAFMRNLRGPQRAK